MHGCRVGDAKITKGYNLPAKFVIHTVGPIFGRDKGKEKELLKSCYINSLKLAVENNIRTIAFPNISTGVFHYPIQEATSIAINAVKDFLARNKNQIEKVYFVSFSDQDLNVYKNILNN